MAAKKTTKKPTKALTKQDLFREDEKCLLLTRLFMGFEETDQFYLYRGPLGTITLKVALEVGSPFGSPIDLDLEFVAERKGEGPEPSIFTSFTHAIDHLGGKVEEGSLFVVPDRMIELFRGMKRPLSGPWHVIELIQPELDNGPGSHSNFRQVAVFCDSDAAEHYVLLEDQTK
jgi:hypothetical protein